MIIESVFTRVVKRKLSCRAPGRTIPSVRLSASASADSAVSHTYGLLTVLRHSLVEGLEEPTNSFMLSCSTLAFILILAPLRLPVF